MSKIDELLKEYCPDGVEYKTLGDLEDSKVILLGRGKVISKKDMTEKPGNYPVYSSSASGNGIIGYYGDYLFDDERLSWSIDGGGRWFYRSGKYSVTNVSGWLKVLNKEIANTKYLYYALSGMWETLHYDYVHKAHPSVIRDEYCIPVPPLPVQQEIVRILDSFTALQDELQKELEERKKQFEHVRDQLMNNGSDVILSDVAEYSKGRVSASEMTTENYVGVDNLLQNKAGKVSATFVPAKGNVIRFERNDILIGNIRPYLKKIWLADTNGGTNGDVLCIHVLDSSSVNPRYLYFVLSSDAFFAYDTVNVRSSGKMPRGDKESVMKYSFTLPSLQEQNDIVRKLESMSDYIYDAIPEELSLRQQQYTYYRDKLLSFPRKEA